MSDNEQRIISCFPPEEFMFGGHIHIVPSMHKWFSFPDLIAAFAPKPMLLSEGGVQEDLERIGKAYALAGAPDNYQLRPLSGISGSLPTGSWIYHAHPGRHHERGIFPLCQRGAGASLLQDGNLHPLDGEGAEQLKIPQDYCILSTVVLL